MVSHNTLLTILVAAIGLVAGDVALARNSYCCNGDNGRLTCGDMLPAACQKRAYRIMDEKGRLVREVEAPLTAEQRAQREAEQARKLEQEKRLAEEKRRNQALLATYPDEKAIDAARDRALADFDKASADTQKRHDAALKRKKQLASEQEFYQKKPLPANLKKQIAENENDLKTLATALDARKQEAEALRAKFEEEKKHYMELRYGKSVPASTPAADRRTR